jgi:hypothetical protein
MFTLVKIAATILALALASPVFGAISLCNQGQLTAVAQHGAGQAYFYLPLDPSLNAAANTAIALAGNDVLIDVDLGPGDGPPLPNPNCIFVTATLPGSLEPGDYTVRWTVRRMVQCFSGLCESDTATFSQPLTVPEQLVCSAGIPIFGPTFDTIPYPPTAGANITALHASWNVIPYVLTDPVVSISGNQIGIAQTGSYSGPTPPTIYCISTSARLGVLPVGHYDLTWQFTTPSKVETYHYSLDVPDSPSIPTLQWPFLLLLALALTATSVSVLRR